MSLSQIEKVAERIDELFYDAFEGIQVKVDPELHGDNYYICISLELSKRLKKRNGQK